MEIIQPLGMVHFKNRPCTQAEMVDHGSRNNQSYYKADITYIEKIEKVLRILVTLHEVKTLCCFCRAPWRWHQATRVHKKNPVHLWTLLQVISTIKWLRHDNRVGWISRRWMHSECQRLNVTTQESPLLSPRLIHIMEPASDYSFSCHQNTAVFSS